MNAVVDACLEGRQWERALELLDELRGSGVAPDQVTYQVLLAGLGQQRPPQWEQAVKFLEELRQQEELSPSSGLRADALCYSAAMRACAEAGKHDQCMQLLHDMQARGVDPLSLTLTACVISCAKSSRMGEVEGLLSSFRGMGVEADPATYQAMLLGYLLAGDSQRCGRTLEVMGKAGVAVDGRVLEGAVQSLAEESGKWHECVRLMDELGERGLPRTEPAFTAAIAACSRALQWEEALRLLQEMMGSGGVKPSQAAFLHAVDALARAQEHHMAVSLVLTTMPKAGLQPEPEVTHAVAALCLAVGDPERAVHLLEKVGAPFSKATWQAVRDACTGQGLLLARVDDVKARATAAAS